MRIRTGDSQHVTGMSAGEGESDQMEAVAEGSDACLAGDLQVGGSRRFRSRRPNEIDGLGGRIKMEGSRKSARDSRERRKMRYRTLEDLVARREKMVQSLRRELEAYKRHCVELDQGRVPQEILDLVGGHKSD